MTADRDTAAEVAARRSSMTAFRFPDGDGASAERVAGQVGGLLLMITFTCCDRSPLRAPDRPPHCVSPASCGACEYLARRWSSHGLLAASVRKGKGNGRGGRSGEPGDHDSPR
ncbi:hypothetical protein GCM10010272_52560 [Streptomyces lateritius]|nr:hypothetical protein GCM10010272_52560 [Streptomyces lateritius]